MRPLQVRNRSGLVYQRWVRRNYLLLLLLLAQTLPHTDAKMMYIAGGEAAGATSAGFRVDTDTGEAGLTNGDGVTWKPRYRSMAV